MIILYIPYRGILPRHTLFSIYYVWAFKIICCEMVLEFADVLIRRGRVAHVYENDQSI